MIYDEREKKLPKWAQEYISDIRRRSDLAWPNVPKPEPCFVADFGGNEFGPKASNVTLWAIKRSKVVSVYIGSDGHEHHKGSVGSRPVGAYYKTREEALAAAWWAACESAATDIHKCANAWRQRDDQ